MDFYLFIYFSNGFLIDAVGTAVGKVHSIMQTKFLMV